MDPVMFLCAPTRKKDGKLHRYFSVLYLGEIDSSQELAWRKSIEVSDEGSQGPRALALFPEDHCGGVLPDEDAVRDSTIKKLSPCLPSE
jgi:hypothetical protein